MSWRPSFEMWKIRMDRKVFRFLENNIVGFGWSESTQHPHKKKHPYRIQSDEHVQYPENIITSRLVVAPQWNALEREGLAKPPFYTIYLPYRHIYDAAETTACCTF